MYNAKVEGRISETEARKIVGDEAINNVMSIDCQLTGRMVDEGVLEMSSSTIIHGCRVTMYYYVVANSDNQEPEDWDYTDFDFVVSPSL